MTSGVFATSVVVEAPSNTALQVETMLMDTMLMETLPVELEALASVDRDTESPASVGTTRDVPQRPAQHRPTPPSSESPVAGTASESRRVVASADHSAVPAAPHGSSFFGHLDAASARLNQNGAENLSEEGVARQGGTAAHGLGGSTAASGRSGTGSGRLLTPRLLAATYRCSDLFPYSAKKDSQDLTLDLDVGPSGTARVRRVREARQVELDFVLAARSCAQRLRFAPAKDESGQATQGRATLRLHFSRNRADG